MILILTCINSNHQTFILFLAFLPPPGVQGLDKIYNVKLIHLKVGFAWIAFQIFQIRCIRRPKSIQSKRQKRADQNHFRTIPSLQSSGQRGSPRSHLTKRLVREQKWSWEKVKWRIPPSLPPSGGGCSQVAASATLASNALGCTLHRALRRQTPAIQTLATYQYIHT